MRQNVVRRHETEHHFLLYLFIGPIWVAKLTAMAQVIHWTEVTVTVSSCIKSSYSTKVSDIILSKDKEQAASVFSGFPVTPQHLRNYLKL